MDALLQFIPLFFVMALLVCTSAFFSCSEAALFYLRRRDRLEMRSGNKPQRMVVELLLRPERLLNAILFWNLIVNIVYFAVASIISLRLEQEGNSTLAGGFAGGSLLLLIFCSEMIPKNIAVLRPKLIATAVSLPLSVFVKIIEPVLPVLRTITNASRRVLLPKFRPEASLELLDIQKAITLSTTDKELLVQEQAVLNNIVSLTEMRVEELMRPRKQYLSFSPPIRLEHLEGELTPSGYLLVSEENTEEIIAAIPLRYLANLTTNNLERLAEPVCFVPWCSKVGETLDLMQQEDHEVAAVLNEYGETIGIVTYDDILDTLFQEKTSRSQRMLQTSSVESLGEGKWRVTGMTSLRRLKRDLNVDLPSTRSVTVSGLLQEVLQRLPKKGDSILWAGLRWDVIGENQRGPLTVQISRDGSKEVNR